MTPSSFDLARSAAYAREHAPNLQAVVRDAAGLGVAEAFRHVRNLDARAEGLDPAAGPRYDGGE